MLTLSDALKLALTKFKIRKIRAVSTAMLAALLLSIILLGTFTYTGIRNSISGAVVSGFDNRQIAYEISTINDFVPQTADDEPKKPFQGEFYDRVAARVAKFNDVKITAQYSIYSSMGIRADGADTDNGSVCNQQADYFLETGQSRCLSASSRDSSMLEPYLIEGYTLTHEDGVVPVVITSTLALSLAGEELDKNATPKEQLDQLNRATTSVAGKQIDISYYDNSSGIKDVLPQAEPATEAEARSVSEAQPVAGLDKTIKAKIVGVQPNASSLLELVGLLQNADSSDIYFTNYLDSDGLIAVGSKEISELFIANNYSTSYFVELGSAKDLKAYVAMGCEGNECYDSPAAANISAYANYQLPFDKSMREAWGFIKFVVGFFATLAVLSVFVTTGKVIVDSRRETGVFRAIGARRVQIAQIYALYTMMLMLVAYTLAFIIATLFALYLTARFGNRFTLQLALVSGTDNIAQPFTFYGITLWHHVVILCGVVFAGWVGAVWPVMRSLRKDPLRYLRED